VSKNGAVEEKEIWLVSAENETKIRRLHMGIFPVKENKKKFLETFLDI
jgi:hypothetical protein